MLIQCSQVTKKTQVAIDSSKSSNAEVFCETTDLCYICRVLHTVTGFTWCLGDLEEAGGQC